MPELRATTTTGTSTVLSEAVVQEFKTSLRGPLHCPGDYDYDAARRVYNAMIDRRPALIARCAGAADIISCVQFARAQNLLVSVRSGGHGVAGSAICDGGLVIDLSSMRGMRVDPVAQQAAALTRSVPGFGEGDVGDRAEPHHVLAAVAERTGLVGCNGDRLELEIGEALGPLGRNDDPAACDGIFSQF